MVLPEGTPTHETDRRRAPALGAVGIALLALLAAALALGRATTPPELVLAGSTTTTDLAPIVPPTTSTTIDPETFSIRQIATGDSFIWFRAPPLEPRWPIEMLEHEGSAYLFASSLPPRGLTHGGGLEVLVSTDGISWRSLGQVIGDEYVINGVDSTRGGLIATGNHIETGTPHIWTSVEDKEWQISDLPDEAVEEELPAFAKPTVAAMFEGRLVVLGNAQSDLLSLIEKSLPESITPADINRYGFEISERDRVLRIHGPLGLVGYSESLERLGIDQTMATWLLYTARTEKSLAWTSADAADWDLNSFHAFYIDHIWHGSDERLFASGSGVFGPMVWSSNDGRSWERIGSSSIGQAQVMWRDRIIATTRDHHLLQSSDGLQWDYLDTGDLLPRELSWDMGPLGAGEAGLAVVATVRREARQTPMAIVMERDDGVLTIDPLSGTLTVSGEDTSVLTIPLWSGEPSDSVQVDFGDRRVTFTSPDSGEEILTVDFATLDQAERLMRSTSLGGERALLSTQDGETWTVQALSDEVGSDVVDRMVVLQDRVILLTHPLTVSVEDASPPQLTVRVGVVQSAGGS